METAVEITDNYVEDRWWPLQKSQVLVLISAAKGEGLDDAAAARLLDAITEVAYEVFIEGSRQA